MEAGSNKFTIGMFSGVIGSMLRLMLMTAQERVIQKNQSTERSDSSSAINITGQIVQFYFVLLYLCYHKQNTYECTIYCWELHLRA